MATIDYIEFKGTKADGGVVYSGATQMVLPPECDKYETVEQVTYYTTGETKVRMRVDNRKHTWHCSTDSTEGNTYDVFIRSNARPTNEQITKAIHKVYTGEFSEHLAEDLENLDIFAVKIDDEIINVEEL